MHSCMPVVCHLASGTRGSGWSRWLMTALSPRAMFSSKVAVRREQDEVGTNYMQHSVPTASRALAKSAE